MSNKLMKTLTPKVDFKKVDKNIEATEALVDVLHKEKTKKTPKVTEKVKQEEPVVQKKEIIVAAPAPVVEPTTEKEILKRLTVDIPVDIFLELRHKSINRFITMREYIIELIKKDLNQ